MKNFGNKYTYLLYCLLKILKYLSLLDIIIIRS